MSKIKDELEIQNKVKSILSTAGMFSNYISEKIKVLNMNPNKELELEIAEAKKSFDEKYQQYLALVPDTKKEEFIALVEKAISPKVK